MFLSFGVSAGPSRLRTTPEGCLHDDRMALLESGIGQSPEAESLIEGNGDRLVADPDPDVIDLLDTEHFRATPVCVETLPRIRAAPVPASVVLPARPPTGPLNLSTLRYRRDDLDAWAKKRRATTTAEADRPHSCMKALRVFDQRRPQHPQAGPSLVSGRRTTSCALIAAREAIGSPPNAASSVSERSAVRHS